MLKGVAVLRSCTAEILPMSYFDNETQLLDLLERHQLISASQRAMVQARQEPMRQQLLKQRRRKSNHVRPGGVDFLDVLVALGLEMADGQPLSEEAVVRLVAEDLHLPFKKLDPLDLDLRIVTKTIPRSFAVNHLILPFAMKNGVLEVAMYDPDNRPVLREIERAAQTKVTPYLATKSDITRMLAEFFGFQSSISAAEDRLAGPGVAAVDLGNLEQYVRIAPSGELASTDQHITAAVDHLFNYAFEQRASDIHIEPKKAVSLVRIRIDGVLHTIYKLPKSVHGAIVSRIKTLSRLDIAEKRRPQDGRIRVDREGKQAEIRVSTIPVAFGEKAVLRILDPDILFQDLETLGFSERDLGVYQGFLARPHGIVLVTGPTGSGKSTTLYSTLKSIATPEINVVTVEDPVEMLHEEFNQISVQPQVDVTFSTILRNILRQDPDVIMIGEIRDLDTATNAMQAALTGHLVFSTLHTNDAVSSITRLIDLGVQPFLVGSTLLGAMAQRLVRRICPHCIEDVAADVPLLMGYGFPVAAGQELILKQGAGCRHCRNTGYFGRCGIFEIFPMSNAMQRLTTALAAESEIRTTAIKEGMTPLKLDAWRKVLAGITTFQEAIRVAGAD